MTLIFRWDHNTLNAEIVRLAGEAFLPVLMIEGEPFPPHETAGSYLLDASVVEIAELQRGGYALLRAVLSPLAP